jgi:hypothetical protein
VVSEQLQVAGAPHTTLTGVPHVTFGSANSPPIGHVTSLDFVGGPGGSGQGLGLGLGGLGQGGGSHPFSFSTALSGGSVFTMQDFVGAAGGPAAGLSPLDVLQGANVTGTAGTVDNLQIQLPGFHPTGGHG